MFLSVALVWASFFFLGGEVLGRTMEFSPFFHNIPEHPADPILTTTDEFKKDPSPNKVNLAIGSYYDEFGKPFVFPAVRNVEQLMSTDKNFADLFYRKNNLTDQQPTDGLFDKNYLGKLGFENLYRKVEELVFLGVSEKILSFHTGSSTQGLASILMFLDKFVDFDYVAVSTPTYSGYSSLVQSYCPSKELKYYRYTIEQELDIENMIKDLLNLPDRTVVILQASCHNPTGLDPTYEDWKRIAQVFVDRPLFPLIDAAYLGFISGDISDDSSVIQLFNNLGIEFSVAVSFSKNLGLYGERVGYGAIKTIDASLVHNISTQIESFNEIPPLQGARDAYFVLENFYEELTNNLTSIVTRIKSMRKGGNFDHILRENGLFTNIPGIDEGQVEYLRTIHHVYVVKTEDGMRINIAGISEKNLKYVSKAIHDTVVSSS